MVEPNKLPVQQSPDTMGRAQQSVQSPRSKLLQVTATANNAIEALRGFYAPALAESYDQNAQDAVALQQSNLAVQGLQAANASLTQQYEASNKEVREFMGKLEDFAAALDVEDKPVDSDECRAGLLLLLEEFEDLGQFKK